jgi:hypothetical protein
MLDPPQYSPDLFIERTSAQLHDRNHFARYRVLFQPDEGAGTRRESQAYQRGQKSPM